MNSSLNNFKTKLFNEEIFICNMITYFIPEHLKMCEQKSKLMNSLPKELLDASSSVECGVS